LRLDDATHLDELGDTEVKIDDSPSTRILAAWRGREDAGLVTHFLFTGPKRSDSEDRSVGVRWVERESPRRRRGPLPFAFVGVLVGAAVSSWLFARARAQRRMKG
jgi:hypothetical protein